MSEQTITILGKRLSVEEFEFELNRHGSVADYAEAMGTSKQNLSQTIERKGTLHKDSSFTFELKK